MHWEDGEPMAALDLARLLPYFSYCLAVSSFVLCRTHCIVLLLYLYTPRKTQPDVGPSSWGQFTQQNAGWLCMMCYLALVSIHFYFITYRASNTLHMMPSSIVGFCFRTLSSSCVENCRAPSSRWSLAWCTRITRDREVQQVRDNMRRRLSHNLR